MTLPSPLSRIVPGEIEFTPPLISLLFANLVTIVFAVLNHWDAATVMFIYWAQSVIIGFFAVLTLLSLKITDVEMTGKTSSGKKDPPRKLSRREILFGKAIIAGFFTLHYGFFHWAYYSFIVDSGLFGPVETGSTGILLTCGLFFVNHLYSYFYHRKNQWQGFDAVSDLFIGPYQRIIPMHVTIVFGGIILLILQMVGIDATLAVLVIFLLFKTWADLGGHIQKHARTQSLAGQTADLKT